MSSNVENTEAQQADEAGLTVFRYKLKPIRDDQWGVIQQSLGCQRWVYNQGVALQKQRMNEGEKRLPYKDLCKSLTDWKKDQEWLDTSPSQALQQTLSGLTRGYQAWRQDPEQFNEPTFKKKSQGKESLIFPTPAHVCWDPTRGRITLPKIGQLRYFKDKRVPDGVLRRATVSRDGNHLVVSITVKNDSSTVRAPSDIAKAIGLDWGVVNRLTLDNGTVFDFPEDTIQALDEAIAKTQRWISHKVEMRKQVKARLQAAIKQGNISAKEKQAIEDELQKRGESNTLRALRAKLRKLHQKKRFLLNNARHQATAKIAAEYGTVYIEATNHKAMTASARGTKDNPGKNVRQKAGLNRQILLTAPGELRRQLEYKTARHGGKVVRVNPAHSAKPARHASMSPKTTALPATGLSAPPVVLLRSPTKWAPSTSSDGARRASAWPSSSQRKPVLPWFPESQRNPRVWIPPTPPPLLLRMGFKPGLTADNEPETLKAQAFSVGQSEYSGQVNDAVRSSATATEFLATDGNPVLQGGEDVITSVPPFSREAP